MTHIEDKYLKDALLAYSRNYGTSQWAELLQQTAQDAREDEAKKWEKTLLAERSKTNEV